MTDFLEKTKAFDNWLRTNGVKVSSTIEIKDLRPDSRGRGVVAVKDIKAGEELFRHKDRSTLIGGVLDAVDADCTIDVKGKPWICLLLQLLVEYGRYLTGESRWNEYFNVLPLKAADLDTLIYWSDEELAHLQASSVIERIGKKDAEAVFRTMLPEIKRRPLFYGFAQSQASNNDVVEDQFLERAHFLSSLIMAYAFDIEPVQLNRIEQDSQNYDDYESDADFKEGEISPKAMVPLADLFNADGRRNNARLFYEDDGSLSMRAICDIKRGDEIFNDYGPLPRSELLRRYGYVTEMYAPYDTVDIPLSLFLDSASCLLAIKPDRLMQKLAKFFECAIDELPDSFELSRASLEEMRPATFRVWNDVEPLVNALSIPSRKAPMKIPMYLQDVLECRLKKYATTLEMDKTSQMADGTSKARPAPSTSERRFDMALQVRTGEKQLLHDALALLRQENDSHTPKKKKARLG